MLDHQPTAGAAGAARARDGGLFGPIRVEDGLIRLIYANPRHAGPHDILFLTDLRGLVRDVARAGAPSANAARLKRTAAQFADEVVFFAEDAPEGFYVYSLSTGYYALGGVTAAPADLTSYIARVDAPFLVRSRHPECAPQDALALTLPAEEVVQGLYRDILQREGDPGGVENYAEIVLDGVRGLSQIAVDLAASDEMAERVLGKRPAPALSQFRAKVLFSRHFADRERLAGRVATLDAAFDAMGLAFDPETWDRPFYEAAFRAAGGDLAAFLRATPPLPLLGL